MASSARALKIIEMPLKRQGEAHESFVPASLPSESPAAIAARKLEALAHFHMALEEYEEALDAFQRLLKLVPARPDLLIQTVACMERLERWHDGAALLQPEVEAHPDWTEAALALGICRLHLNQAEEAFAVFQSVEARSPGNSVAKEGMRAAEALLGPPPPPARPDNWEVELYELSVARNWEGVLTAAARYQEEGEPSAHFYAAHALEQAGDFAQAISTYEKCLEGNPSHREARYNLACLLIRQENFLRASQELELLTSIDSSNWPAWWNYLLASERAGRHEQAITAAQRLIQMDGFTPELRFRLAFNCLNAGRLEEASRQFEHCLEADPAWVEARLNLGLAWDRMGKQNEAREVFHAILREHPLLETAKQALLESLLTAGDTAAALRHYEDLEKRGAAPASASYTLAKLFEARGEDHLALRYLERALRVDPGCSDALLCLGEILARQGDHEKERRCKSLALAVDPAVAIAYFRSATESDADAARATREATHVER